MIAPTVVRFFQVCGQTVFRGYGGLKSDVPNFKDAIEQGVRFFDNAFVHQDAPKMREALLGRDVSQFILSSKIPGHQLDKNDFRGSTEKCFNTILEGYGIDKIDIMYLHGPDCLHKEVLDVLMELKEVGKIKYVGLSNVENKETLEAIINAGYSIDVIENEFNPCFWDSEMLEYCQKNDIFVVGYRPFGDNESHRLLNNDVLIKIAAQVNSTIPRVILQWINQKGVTPIPHANKKEHIQDNATIPEWTLTQEQINDIDTIKNNEISMCKWKKKYIKQDLEEMSKAWLAQLPKSKV